MEYRTLGRTGLKVSALGLGTMMFGAWGNVDRTECSRIIHRALDSGINFVDTADVYSAGESEEIVGEALKGSLRKRVILATKVHGVMEQHPNGRGNSRRWIVQEVDESLKRLKTDWIDLYQIHRPDPEVDIDETLGVLTDLVRSGKIRYFGSSTFPAHDIVEAQWVAQLRGRERFAAEQPPYSLLVRGIEAAVLPTCQKYGLGVVTWSPLAAGWLSGLYQKNASPKSSRSQRLPLRYDLSIRANQDKLEAAIALADLASSADLSLIHLALGFVLSNPGVTSAIIGPRTMDHLISQVDGWEVTLDDHLLDKIDEIIPPGTNVNPTDSGWDPPTLSDSRLRRRNHGGVRQAPRRV